MPKVLILDDDQAKLFAGARETVELRDRRGNPLGTARPREDAGFTDEDIAIAKRRLASDEPRYTTREVLDYLAFLEEPGAGRQ